MIRISLALVVSLALCGLVSPRAARADYAPAAFRAAVGDPDDDDQHQPAPKAKDAGAIDGHVVAVDYRSNTITVVSGSRKVDVVVLPSTNIRGEDNDFRTIADITRGAKIRVTMSLRGGSYTAQIIHLTH